MKKDSFKNKNKNKKKEWEESAGNECAFVYSPILIVCLQFSEVCQ